MWSTEVIICDFISFIICCSASDDHVGLSDNPPRGSQFWGGGGIHHFMLRGVAPPASWNKLTPICEGPWNLMRRTLKGLKVANVA